MSAAKTRVMYIQGGGLQRIGRVEMSKTGRTVYYRGIELLKLAGAGVAGNHMDVATREEYWVSGPRKDGQDTLRPGLVEIDDDVREAYWRDVRGMPDNTAATSFRSLGAHGRRTTR